MTMHDPAHPGEILKELIVEPLELSLTDVAQHLNVSRKTLSRIVNAKSGISPEMAVRLELVFHKPSAEHWLRLQNAYDLWQAKQKQDGFHIQPYSLEYA
ncbi:MAG TPA: addiction module antidote protein, HigA family [Thiomicrospira sp.]|nr:addiction module antidote protein, HigA family [Thiomicrospira sp.]